MTLPLRQIISILVLLLYLLGPFQALVHACQQTAGETTVQVVVPVDAPCDDCPCSGDQDSNCCDTCSCLCSCHTLSNSHILQAYTPFVITQRCQESDWSLPQVYLSIVVPPQNNA